MCIFMIRYKHCLFFAKVKVTLWLLFHTFNLHLHTWWKLWSKHLDAQTERGFHIGDSLKIRGLYQAKKFSYKNKAI